MNGRLRAVADPGHVGIAKPSEVETAAALGHVLDHQRRIAIAKRLKNRVQPVDLRQIAVERTMIVSAAIAIDPHVVVPLQIVGMNLVDEARELVEHPLAAGPSTETDLPRLLRHVETVASREPRVFCQTRLADRVEIDARGFDPQAELQTGVAREIGDRAQAVRKSFRIRRPVAEAGLEIERAVTSGALIPTSVEHEQL